MVETKGSLSRVDDKLNKLCMEIIEDDYNPIKKEIREKEIFEFSIDNIQHYNAVQKVLKAVASKATINSYLKKIRENCIARDLNSSVITNMNRFSFMSNPAQSEHSRSNKSSIEYFKEKVNDDQVE